MKRNQLILLLAIITGAAIFMTAFLIKSNVVETHKIYTEIIVDDNIGFNLNTDALRFGKARPGNYATRYLDLKHDNDMPLTVSIYVEGGLKDWISTDANEFLLAPDEVRRVAFRADVPRDAGFGNYTGTIIINFLS